MSRYSHNLTFDPSFNNTGVGFYVNTPALELNAAPPDISKARKKRNDNMIKNDDQDAPIFSTSLEYIGRHGVALELYFVTVKHIGFLFLIISLISIWPILINYFAEGLKSGERNQVLDQFNLSNQVAYDYTMSKDDAEDKLESNKGKKIQIVVADFIYTLIFILYLLRFKKIVDRRVLNNQLSNPSTTDYSVEVTGFNNRINPEELKEFIETNFGTTIEVYLARNYKGNLTSFKSYEDLINQRAYLERLQQEGNINNINLENINLKIQRMRENKRNAIRQLGRINELPSIKAFVIFNSNADRNKCIMSLAKRCFGRSINYSFRLRGKIISAKETSEPSNINWENLEYGCCKRFMRGILSVIFGILVVLVSIAIVYAVRTYDDGLPSNKTCKIKEDIDSSLSISEAKLQFTSDTQKYCYCKAQSLKKVLTDSTYRSFCKYYLEKRTLGIIYRVLVSLSVVIINFSIKQIFKFLGRYEIETSKTKEVLKVSRKLSIALFINTALVVLFVNADFSSISFTKKLPFNEYLFNSEHSDFTRAWYLEAGSTITLTMIISILSPHLYNLIYSYPRGLLKMYKPLTKYKTQLEIDNAFVGPEFDLASRYAHLFTIIFTSFMYSGGIPLLNCTCCASFFFIFWVDKFLLLRYYSKPPRYSSELNSHLLKTLPFAAILHCGFSLYMTGAEDVFPESFYEKNGYLYPNTNTLIDRVASVFGIFYIILIFAAILVYLLITGSYMCCGIKNRGSVVSRIKDFNEIEEEMSRYSLTRYDLSYNPKYSRFIAALNSAVEDHNSFYESNRMEAAHNSLEDDN